MSEISRLLDSLFRVYGSELYASSLASDARKTAVSMSPRRQLFRGEVTISMRRRSAEPPTNVYNLDQFQCPTALICTQWPKLYTIHVGWHFAAGTLLPLTLDRVCAAETRGGAYDTPEEITEPVYRHGWRCGSVRQRSCHPGHVRGRCCIFRSGNGSATHSGT
jgi:hypothetical protein